MVDSVEQGDPSSSLWRCAPGPAQVYSHLSPLPLPRFPRQLVWCSSLVRTLRSASDLEGDAASWRTAFCALSPTNGLGTVYGRVAAPEVDCMKVSVVGGFATPIVFPQMIRVGAASHMQQHRASNTYSQSLGLSAQHCPIAVTQPGEA